MFDKERGIPGLEDAYPNVMKVVGVTFAVLFTGFRIIMWPWVNYYFWTDMYTVHQSEEGFHNSFCAYFFFAVNIFLTVLQLVWFGEILSQGKALLFGDKQESSTSTKKSS